jgi:chain length determinant protein tyrosine kinase EpsG
MTTATRRLLQAVPPHDNPSAKAVNEDYAPKSTGQEKSIGEIMRKRRSLSDAEVDRIVAHQHANNLRFGESAVTLGLATDQEVVFALSQQFDYPYSPDDRPNVSQELVAAAQPFGQKAEAFRAIRSQLMQRVFNPTETRRALAIVSPDSGDGKTYFASNLGVVLAQLGGRTLIVDANLRKPRLHQVFGIPNRTGLSTILSGRQEESIIFQAPDIPSLFVMPVGVIPPNPLELIERPAFRLLIGELLRKFDHVLVDTPSAGAGADPAVISQKCGSTLVIARKGKSKMRIMQDLVESIAGNSKLAGVIFNNQ